ncbi:MAG: ATP-binding cassette domain-containing protein [Desulfobacterales bacterium]|nr:ATP-binding cassette domain-containing protein [Desulfobacterales bacterium]
MQLTCRHIHFRHPGTDKLLFDDLNLHFKGPGFHAFFGPSGVGKSSLAHIITGRLKADGGEVHFDGARPPLYTHNQERLPDWSGIGRHLERITPAAAMEKKNTLVEVFGLSSLLKHRFSQLSLGQQNRINLVRYLVQDFQVLIMDESLANVDEQMRGRILLTMKAMFPEALFIYISHNVVEVATYCRWIWVLRGWEKAPPAVLVQGRDQLSGQGLDRQGLERTMLEIMNAA